MIHTADDMVERRGSPLDRAITLAVVAHEGQVDKGGTPYILHPLRIMLGQAEMERRIVAVLHDVVEDSDVTLDTIRADHGDTIADAVAALTRCEGESYDDFIRRSSPSDELTYQWHNFRGARQYTEYFRQITTEDADAKY